MQTLDVGGRQRPHCRRAAVAGFRVAFTGLDPIRCHSIAMRSIDWSIVSVLRTVTAPTPARSRSCRNVAMTAGVRSRSR